VCYPAAVTGIAPILCGRVPPSENAKHIDLAAPRCGCFQDAPAHSRDRQHEAEGVGKKGDRTRCTGEGYGDEHTHDDRQQPQQLCGHGALAESLARQVHRSGEGQEQGDQQANLESGAQAHGEWNLTPRNRDYRAEQSESYESPNPMWNVQCLRLLVWLVALMGGKYIIQ
jgi:hypothetical protein